MRCVCPHICKTCACAWTISLSLLKFYFIFMKKKEEKPKHCFTNHKVSLVLSLLFWCDTKGQTQVLIHVRRYSIAKPPQWSIFLAPPSNHKCLGVKLHDHHKNKRGKWIGLEMIILSELSKEVKDNYCMFSLTCKI